MKKSHLLSTAAVALMLGTGATFAQAPSKDQAPAQPAPAAQQTAPPEKVAPPSQSVEKKASEVKANDAKPSTTQAQQPDAAVPNNATPKTAADSDKADMKTPPAAGKAEMKGAAEPNKAAESNKPADSNKAATSAPERATTGQGAGAAARLSTEQRSKITTVIKQQKVERVDAAKLNITINVGTRVPDRGVRFHPLPQEVFVIYPEWRGYDYILVGDQIVVVDPRSHEIVAILDA